MGGSALAGETPYFAYSPFESCLVMNRLSDFAAWLDEKGFSRRGALATAKRAETRPDEQTGASPEGTHHG
jgi:hypothetical protein